VFERKPPNVIKKLGFLRSYRPVKAKAIRELVAQARRLGANAIYNLGPLFGYGCGSPTGPQDIVIVGWGATAGTVRHADEGRSSRKR
jgi:hypothetical protein